MQIRIQGKKILWVIFGFGSIVLSVLIGVKGCPPKDVRVIQVAGISAPVDVYRDEWGIPHIYGQNEADTAFAQGYIQASDRFLQMEIIRSSANGTLSRLLGPGEENEIFNYDRQQRMFGFRRVGQLIAQKLRDDVAAGDEKKAAFLKDLESFAAGVNTYIDGMISGRIDVPPVYLYLLGGQPEEGDILPWSIEDTFSFGRLQSFELSYDGGDDINLGNWMSSYLKAFGTPSSPGLIPGREGLFADLFRMEPIFKVSSLYGFAPTRSKISIKSFPFPDDLSIQDEVLRKKMAQFSTRSRKDTGYNGSNNWVVSGSLTQSGFPMLADDPHLSLDLPSIFYLVHVNTKDAGGAINVMGATFVLEPGVIVGFNDQIAWGVTTFGPDVTDVYVEQITHGPNGDTVAFNDPFDNPDRGLQQVPIDTVTEMIEVRNPKTGEISVQSAEIRVVPHHGPLLMEGETEGISVRWTGFEPSEEARAFYEINHAQNLDQFKEGLKLFDVGAQNFVYADIKGNIFYSGHSWIPRRAPAALTNATPPYLPLPGQGQHEWIGRLSDNEIPQLVNPEPGYIATANNTADGAIFDNNPLNDGVYLGTYFDLGCREARITQRLEEARQTGQKLTIQDMQALQGDTFSCTGALLTPMLLTAIAQNGPLDDAAVAEAAERLQDWNFETPAAISTDEARTESTDLEERAASVATTIFNLWQNFFLHNLIDDEISAINSTLPDQPVGFISNSSGASGYRGIYKILADPASTNVGDKIFDDISTPQIETRNDIMISSLYDAVAKAAEIFGTLDQNAWLWGKLHTITFEDLTGVTAYNIPSGEEEDENGFPTGFPRHGDKFAVDACETSFLSGLGTSPDNRNDFTYDGGPTIRFVVEMIPGNIQAFNILPGGESADRLDPHYDDQALLWVKNEAAPMHFYTRDVLLHQRSRIRFEPVQTQ